MAKGPKTQNASASPRRAKKPSRRGGRRAAAASRTADATLNDIDRLRDDLVRLSQTVSALISGRADEARNLVSETASEYYETGLGYARDAQNQVRGIAGDVARQVERNPLAAIGIVFGVGYIIGLMRRR